MKRKKTAFDVEARLESTGAVRGVTVYRPQAVIFSQGDPCDSVFYLERGTVKLSVISPAGKEAVVGLLEAGDFLGEGALTGQRVRIGTATTLTASTLVEIATSEMHQQLQADPELAAYFLQYVRGRNIRVEADLVNQLFNSSEKRLARTLLLLARFGKEETPHRVLPKISQETLAEMVGTTRSRVNFFMNKFRRLGFIDYNGELKVNNSLVSVVLHD